MAVPVADDAQVALDVANLRLSKRGSLALKFLIGLRLRHPRKGVALGENALSLPHVSAASVRVAVESVPKPEKLAWRDALIALSDLKEGTLALDLCVKPLQLAKLLAAEYPKAYDVAHAKRWWSLLG